MFCHAEMGVASKIYVASLRYYKWHLYTIHRHHTGTHTYPHINHKSLKANKVLLWQKEMVHGNTLPIADVLVQERVNNVRTSANVKIVAIRMASDCHQET